MGSETSNTSSMPGKSLLNVDEAATYLNLSPHTIRKYVELRRIPFVKIGAAVRFERDAIDAFVAERRVARIAWS